MKIEIEVTEEEIKSAIERKVRVAIASETKNWGFDDYITKDVKRIMPGIFSSKIKEKTTL